MKVSTFIYHDLEGYLPSGSSYRKYKEGDSKYGYNDMADVDLMPDEDGDQSGATITLVASSITELRLRWMEFAIKCTRIRGADDDHYDYFPSAWSGLIDLALQIDAKPNAGPYCVPMANEIWDDHAYDYWARNYVNQKTLEEAAEEFAQEIIDRPTGTIRTH